MFLWAGNPPGLTLTQSVPCELLLGHMATRVPRQPQQINKDERKTRWKTPAALQEQTAAQTTETKETATVGIPSIPTTLLLAVG